MGAAARLSRAEVFILPTQCQVISADFSSAESNSAKTLDLPFSHSCWTGGWALALMNSGLRRSACGVNSTTASH